MRRHATCEVKSYCIKPHPVTRLTPRALSVQSRMKAKRSLHVAVPADAHASKLILMFMGDRHPHPAATIRYALSAVKGLALYSSFLKLSNLTFSLACCNCKPLRRMSLYVHARYLRDSHACDAVPIRRADTFLTFDSCSFPARCDRFDPFHGATREERLQLFAMSPVYLRIPEEERYNETAVCPSAARPNAHSARP